MDNVERPIEEYLVYGAMTLRCVDKLIAKTHNWTKNIGRDAGPHWRCTISISNELTATIADIRRHVAIKKEYTAFVRPELVGVCTRLETALQDFEAILREEIFNRYNYIGDIIRWKLVRRYEAPGCLQLQSGRDVLSQLEGIDANLRTMKDELIPKISQVLKPA